MLNQMDNPAEMLAWLSQRNHHIPLEDLAFMITSQEFSGDIEEPFDFNLDDDFINHTY